MMILALTLLVAFVAADHPVAHPKSHPAPHAHYTYLYHGHYQGTCHANGLYYRDAYSFVSCSNGLAYVMACAPGTANSGKYRPGHKYEAQIFCDVNLNDLGYAAHHQAQPKKDEHYKVEQPVAHPVAHPVVHPVAHPVAHPVSHPVVHSVAHPVVYPAAVHQVAYPYHPYGYPLGPHYVPRHPVKHHY